MRLVSPTPGLPLEFTDDDLVDAVLAGDGRVARHLHARLAPVLRRVLRRISGSNPADLEDLLQIAFERIIISIRRGTFRRGAKLETWAAVIATRAGMDHLRRLYRRNRFFLWGQPPEQAAPETRPELQIELAELRRTIAELKPDHVEVLFLHDTMGYDLNEIAAELNITAAAAQSRLVRTRSELIRRLKAQEGRRK